MAGDYSRKRFDRDKRYSGVLMQQGRVQLDSDWNEGVAISDRRWRAETLDVVGRCGVPNQTPHGFEIGIDASGDLTIGRGRMYVDGFLAENFGGGPLEFDPVLEEELGKEALPFGDQDEFPDAGDLAPEQGRHLVFLDVWRREVTFLEDPDVVEQAVGVDTTTRWQTAWRVDLLHNVGPNVTCQTDEDAIPGWPDRTRPSAGRLSTAEAAVVSDKGPCVIPPSGGYRGLENRLYRVEIHDGGGVGDATFKWSRHNGAVATSVTAIPSLDTLRVVRTQRDDVLRFNPGDWVEITDDWLELAGLPGIMAKVADVDHGTRTITLHDDLPAGLFTTNAQHLTDPDRHTRVRRWDQSGEIRDTDGNLLVDLDAVGADGVIPVPAAGRSIVIEDGVEIAFSLDADIGSDYHTADHWSFATRTADASVEILDQAPPRGLHHHFCRLAVVDHDGETFVGEPLDCRPGFPPLTEIPTGGETCCEVTVGDGRRSVGDFTDIQEAVDSLPDGGTVCVLPGQYRIAETIRISAGRLTLRGCGRHSEIRTTGDDPVVAVVRSRETRLENLTLFASTNDATVVVRDSRSTEVIGCMVVNSAKLSGPEAAGGDDVSAAGAIPMERPAGRRVALGDRRRGREIDDPPELGAAFERRFDSERPDVPSKITGIAIKATRCEDVQIHGCSIGGRLAILVQAELVSIRRNRMKGGGVWVADGSSRVSIDSNQVVRGASPGVVLGGIPPGLKASETAAGIEDASIISNLISGMGGSGITSVVRFGDQVAVGDLEGILIEDNRIEECGLDGLDDRFDPHAVGGVVLRDGAAVTIAGNEIVGSADGDEGALGCGVFVHGCLGLDVSRNRITGFGAEAEQRYRCIDFEKMRVGSDYPNPLVRDGLSLTTRDRNGNELVGNEVMRIGRYTGLSCPFDADISLDREVSQATITMAVAARPASAIAYGADGAELDKASTGGPDQNPHTMVLDHPGIRRIRIRAPQGEALVLKLCIGAASAEVASFQAGIAAWWVFGGDRTGGGNGRAAASESALPAVTIHDNVVSCRRGPGLVAVGIGDFSICDNWFESRGVVTQIPVSGGDESDHIDTLVQNSRTGVVLDLGQAADHAVYGARMVKRGMEVTHLPAAAFVRVVPSGRVLIDGNQARLTVDDAMEKLFNFSVVALDDVAFNDNQLEVWAPGAPATVNLLVWSPTLRVAANRFTEIPDRALLSCGTLGPRFNNTVDNQGTHCILPAGGIVTNRDNHFVRPGICRGLIDLIAKDKRIFRWNG